MRKKNEAPLILLAAGGTGGHVFPAKALAGELMERGFRLTLVTDRRGGNLKNELAGIDTRYIWAGGIAGKSIPMRLISFLEIFVGFIQAWFLLKKLRPSVVVGFGGYASVPTMLAAIFVGISSIIHEQNAVLGRANRLLARRVKLITTSFEKVHFIPDKSKSNVIVTGMPVRSAIQEMRGQSYNKSTTAGMINLMVFGGSQGASIFSTIVPAALEKIDSALRGRINITQQCRIEDIERTQSYYKKLNIQANISNFFYDMPVLISQADLIICRSGASTIAELTTIGRPAILVPYSYAVDDHQTHNAYAIDEIGGGWLIPEKSFTDNILAERLDSLFSLPKTLENAQIAAWGAGKPDAANKLANAVLGLLP